MQCFATAQNPLYIPPTLSGDTFNLAIQNGVTQFYAGINTPTYGINGNLLAPTLIVNKWDWVTMNVTNNLTGFGNATTIHWHGLHVPAKDDGGPHQVIPQGTTWRPHFQILNSAGTFWYHPHGDNKTDLHVSKGLAGMIIVKDSVEANLNLPREYGVDDFPIIIQSKAFDVLNQIAISTELDTAICVNGTIHPVLNAPAQLIRLRLVNGSSMRSYNLGFSNNHSFKMIASDAGLLDSALTLTRVRLSPGERAEIVLDLTNELGNTLSLTAYNSEFPNGIYGAATVTGMMGGTIPDYDLNPLNGSDFEILQIQVAAQTANPILTMPTALTTNTPWSNYTVSRVINLAPDSMMSALGQVAGPFNINGVHFDMNTINVTTTLNTTEKWRIMNQTGIAHPFHIHDMHFYLLDVNGGPVPAHEKGKKDVVMIMPQQYVEFITKFEDFADDSIPYMYHCHLLHHEDDGMMGSFRVIDPNAQSDIESTPDMEVFPNPCRNSFTIDFNGPVDSALIELYNMLGEVVSEKKVLTCSRVELDASNIASGIYILRTQTSKGVLVKRLIKN